MPEEDSAPVESDDEDFTAMVAQDLLSKKHLIVWALLGWFKKNPSVPVAILALIVSCLALRQSHRSADIASDQLRLASRPLLYGNCTFTRSDFLRLSPIPDAIMVAVPQNASTPLMVETLTKPLPSLPLYEQVFPWIVNRCSITNTGRGTAQGIKFGMTTMFVNMKTQMPTSGKVGQEITIDLLAPGSSYDFVVGNQREDTALILMPQTVTYQVGPKGENVTVPLVHSAFWNQLTLDNRKNPKI
jgi:hypothetical protein